MRVDGVDLRDVQLESYRRQLGVVLQDPFLFAGTIADNIRFARPDANDEEVRAAAAAVGVDRVAARLEDGLDHAVREGGAGLSAGERQLISIARALLADPRILILDEATSTIDRPTEVLIERALDRLLRGRTSLIIAHRLATVRRADEILVVDHGRVVQRGDRRPTCWRATAPSGGSRSSSRGRPTSPRSDGRRGADGRRLDRRGIRLRRHPLLRRALPREPARSRASGMSCCCSRTTLQRRLGAAVAEVDHHELWQRSRLTLSLVDRTLAGTARPASTRPSGCVLASGYDAGPFARELVTPEDLEP